MGGEKKRSVEIQKKEADIDREVVVWSQGQSRRGMKCSENEQRRDGR